MLEAIASMWKNYKIPLLVVFGTFLLRFLWLSDMEFKKDELATTQMILNLGTQPYSPLGPIATHSGFAHSSGFFYLVRWLTLGSKDPVMLAAAIAGLNALFISIFLIVFRKSRELFLCFALCATSMALTLYSRKIWTPNLVVPWLVLGLGLFFASRQFKRPFFNALAAFSMMMAGHMYPPGGFIAAVVTVCVLLSALTQRDRSTFMTWLIGSALGGLTYVPYLVLLFAHVPGSHGTAFTPPTFEWGQLKSAYAHAAVLPSSFGVYAAYLRPIKAWIIQTLSDSTQPTGPRFTLIVTLIWVIFSTFIGTTLLWTALCRMLFSWRMTGKKLLRDPMALSAVVLLCVMPWALFFTRMGSYLHYWLGVLPFVYYLIPWTMNLNAEKTFSKILMQLAWSLCVTSFFASFQFIVLVHHYHGLPGEYGPSYSEPVQGAND